MKLQYIKEEIEKLKYSFINYHEESGRVSLLKNENNFEFEDIDKLNSIFKYAISDFRVSFDTTNDTLQIELLLNSDFAIDIRNEGFNWRTNRFYSTWFIEDVDIRIHHMKDSGELPQDFEFTRTAKESILKMAVTSEWVVEEINNKIYDLILKYVEEYKNKSI